jgi:phage replication O-like protein O
MASPQKENGYTPIANELMEALSQPGINGSEYRILLTIIRKTYGYHKKRDRISLSQFEQLTSMDRKQAVETIKALVGKKIIVKDGGFYRLNKNWEEWVVGKRPLHRGSGQKTTAASGQKPTKSSGQLPTHKRKKETITKENGREGVGYNPLGAEIIRAFEAIDPKNKTYYGNTTQRAACDFLLDEYGLDEVLKRIEVLGKTNKMPYFPTITTPVQLRDKWVQLHDAVARKKGELQSKQVKVI